MLDMIGRVGCDPVGKVVFNMDNEADCIAIYLKAKQFCNCRMGLFLESRAVF